MRTSTSMWILLCALLGCTVVGCAEDGADGADGTNGMDGADGQNGQDGTDGQDGMDYVPTGDSDYRTETQAASDQVDLAAGLSAAYLTREAGNKTDMMAFWPVGGSPTHIITCVEGGRETLGDGRYNPSVQAIALADGTVTTILRGMDRCDGIRATAWGTILATEETVDGSAYEILDPLASVDLYISDRGAPGAAASILTSVGGDASAEAVKRTELPTMSWEGLEVLATGVVIGGDEHRPGSYENAFGSDDTDGGALFKFVPSSLHGGGAITMLSESPLVAGTTHALQVSCRDSSQQYGQGCEIGNGAWIAVDPDNARFEADENGATGYYRPEDLHVDPAYAGAGVRFCWANTGNAGAGNYGEVICGVDSMPELADPATRSVIVNRFVEGDAELNQPDNLAFHPNGTLYVIEDNHNGDVWACLPDGDDRDIKTDGCVRMLSVEDYSAEPTGFIFSPDGLTAYVSIQHTADGEMPDFDGYATDDVLAITGFAAPDAAAVAGFGAATEASMLAQSRLLFGFDAPIGASATGTDDHRVSTLIPGREPSLGDTNFGEDASAQLELAAGLTATYLTRTVANHADMGSFWPYGSDSPTHLIFCIEGGREVIDGGSQYNPSVQAIDLSDGTVTTILRGLDRCDGLRVSPWGTAIATEEVADGGVYEILDPLDGEEYTVTDRGAAGAAATIVDSMGMAQDNVVKRNNLPAMAWEGWTAIPSGVVYGGDELRPGSYDDDDLDPDTDGGAMFKFVPATLRTESYAITDLVDSPLSDGTTYALQVSCRDDRQQYGQGCEVGNGAWVEVDSADAREDANRQGATGYYRPEDLHLDPVYDGPGVRFCWTNTGNEGASNFAEVVCAIDYDPDHADPTLRTVVANRFVEGDADFNSHDNLAFQPHSGVTYVIEDHENGDIWACLPDAGDRDIKSDGCVKLLSIVDTSAEPTGFLFSPDGRTAYFVVQHSDGDGVDMVLDNYDTDDMIAITGFVLPSSPRAFGEQTEDRLHSESMDLFGFGTPLAASATQD